MKTPRGDHGSKTYSHRPRQLTRDYRIRWGWLGLGGWIETCAPDHCSWSCGTGLRWNDIRFYAGDFVVAVLMLCRRAHSKCTGEECVSVCVFDWFLFATNEIDLDMRICSPLSVFIEKRRNYRWTLWISIMATAQTFASPCVIKWWIGDYGRRHTSTFDCIQLSERAQNQFDRHLAT